MAVPQLGGGPRAAARGLGAVPQGGGGLKVRAPAETGPLVVEGATKGRNKVDQSQAQAGPQAAQEDSAETRRPKKRAVCLAVRRGDYCVDKSCPKEHPARCGDPLCFPTWRKDCQLWHVRSIQGRQ